MLNRLLLIGSDVGSVEDPARIDPTAERRCYLLLAEGSHEQHIRSIRPDSITRPKLLPGPFRSGDPLRLDRACIRLRQVGAWESQGWRPTGDDTANEYDRYTGATD